ncbi:TetR/AcrR family transcriptional regulator [Arthrobacter sp. UYEF3]|uniref:TetR/AcrR family transcriptional regulator n=1 Tax=Arthrobacter sp. UYEF3 TaxID=1756365 RepID=UPI00339A3048
MTQIDPTVAGVDTPKLGRKRDHTRDPEILAAALDVLAESGYERMTIDMVATRAKAGKATLYRRWASKAELVIDAVACMKNADIDMAKLPDTGTLRGDLLASIKPHSIEDNDRKIHVMAGLMSMISCDPGLSDAVQSAIVEPRASVNRLFLQRAIDRGEIPADCDTEKLSLLVTSMAMYRTMVQRKTANREFLISVIDELLLPAVGLHP